MGSCRICAALAWSLGLIVLASIGCAPPEGGAGSAASEPPSETPRNVLLIVVDTLRADHLGSYGYARDTSPNLDALAANNFLFENHSSQAACTYPSVNSMLTSRGPALFFTGSKRYMGIPDRLLSLPQVLQHHGYRTLGVSASPIVRATPSKHNPDGGFGGGFDVFDEHCEWNHAICVNNRALHLLDTERTPENAEEDDVPFFLYLHYMEPHGPYRPPAIHQPRFLRPYEGHDFVAMGNPNPIARMLYDDGEEVEISGRDLEHLVDLYDEEIAFFDQQLGALLARLDERGLLDELLVVVASDHGEEFLEHEHIKHCRSLYQAVIGTPLVVKPPASLRTMDTGSRVDAITSNLDIVPTILDYVGVRIEAAPFEGNSLRPLIERGMATEPGVEGFEISHSVQNVYRSMREGRYKLIYNLRENQGRLFDLQADPDEQRELQQTQPETYRTMRRELMRWLDRQGEDRRQSIQAAEETTARLKALGYLQ